MKKKYQKIKFKSDDINVLDLQPLNFKELQAVIDRISEKYPYCKKHEITFVVKQLLEISRREIFQGNTINIQGFLQKTRLYSYCKLYGKKTIINIKIQTNTPRKIYVRT